MKLVATTLLFFDASCLIAASASPNGGSGFLLALCRRRRLSGAVSHHVLLEAERNIATKIGRRVLDSYHVLLMEVPLVVAPAPIGDRPRPWHRIINAKDRHVVASALACHAQYLISLDRGLNAEVGEARQSFQAMTPGEFIKNDLVHHEDYGSLSP